MRRVLAAVVLMVVGAVSVPPVRAADDPGRPQQWALDRIGAAAGDGAGVTVAVLDSGVDLGHVDLRDGLVPGIDLVDDDDVPQDANGHGTHVAGIIGARAGNGVGIAGVAPGASIMPVRVLDADGAGTVEDVAAGIRWAIDHGADVLNLSVSEAAQALFGPSLADALRAAWEAGVVPVVAAGNQYVLGSGFADEPALVVAATTREDGKPSYSSAVGAAHWGLSAPGGEQPLFDESAAILSTYWVEGKVDQYAYHAGSSMAAPHVAGAVAVLLGLGLSPIEAVERLLGTAKDLGPAGRDNLFGAGRLDLAAATTGFASASPPPAVATATPAPTAGGGSSAPTPSVGAATPPPPVTVEPTALPTTTTTGPPTSGDASAPVVADLGPATREPAAGPSRAVPATIAALLIACVVVSTVVIRPQAPRDAR